MSSVNAPAKPRKGWLGRRKGVVIAVAAVLAVACLAPYALKEGPVKVSVARVEAGSVTRTVEADGTVVAADEELVYPEEQGVITRVYVREGQLLEPGALIAEIDRERFLLDVERAAAHLAAVQSEYSDVAAGARTEGARTEEIEIARAELQAARVDYEKALEEYKSLPPSYAAGKDAYEKRHRTLLAAQAKLTAAAERLHMLEAGPRDATLEAWKEKVRAAAADLDAANLRLERTRITSSSGGTLLKLYVKKGMMVGPSTMVALVGDCSHLEVEAQVDQEDVGEVAIGQEVRISAEGYPRIYAGRVKSIAPLAERNTTSVGLEQVQVGVTCAVDEPDDLIPGLEVDVTILAREEEGVVAPRSALRRGGDGVRAFVVDEGVARETVVTVGLEGDEKALILEGLSEGQEVVVFPPDDLEDGDPVEIENGA